MTREEALIKVRGYLTNLLPTEDYDEVEEIMLALEQQPCGDCISRQEAIRVAEQGQIQGYVWQFKKLCALPPVEPERKTGKWIMSHDKTAKLYGECSNCGMRNYAGCTNYCPDCGAKMEVN